MYCSKDVQPVFRVERLKMPLALVRPVVSRSS